MCIGGNGLICRCWFRLNGIYLAGAFEFGYSEEEFTKLGRDFWVVEERVLLERLQHRLLGRADALRFFQSARVWRKTIQSNVTMHQTSLLQSTWLGRRRMEGWGARIVGGLLVIDDGSSYRRRGVWWLSWRRTRTDRRAIGADDRWSGSCARCKGPNRGLWPAPAWWICHAKCGSGPEWPPTGSSRRTAAAHTKCWSATISDHLSVNWSYIDWCINPINGYMDGYMEYMDI